MKTPQPCSRRSFLARTALATSAFALSNPALNAFAANQRGLKKSLKFTMIQEGKTILDKLQLIKTAGFDGVEFEIDYALKNKAEILAARDATGILIPGLVAGANGRKFSDSNPAIRSEGIKHYKTGLQTAKELGATTVLLYPGRVTKTDSYDHVYAQMKTSIKEVIPAAEKTGTKIALENVWNNFLLSPLEARDFVDSFHHPLVGWYFDIGNVITLGWPEQWIRILNKRIFKLDIKEFSRKKQDNEGKRKGFDVNLLEGDNDWPDIMKALDEIHYAGGWGSAEMKGGGLDRLTDISHRMDKIFAL